MPWSPPRPRPRPVHGLPLIFLFLLSIPRPRPGPFPLPRPLCPTETKTRIKQLHQAAMNHLMKRVSVRKAFLHGCCFIPRMFPRFICSLAWRPLP